MYPGIFLPDRYLPLPKASSLLHLYIYNVQFRRYYPGATDPAYVLYYIDGNHIYRGKGEHSPDNADSQMYSVHIITAYDFPYQFHQILFRSRMPWVEEIFTFVRDADIFHPLGDGLTSERSNMFLIPQRNSYHPGVTFHSPVYDISSTAKASGS